MLNKISVKLSDILVQSGADPAMKDIYAYGAECTLGTAFVLLVLLLYSVLAKQFLLMLVYIVAWLPLRIFVGGAHAHTHIGCNLTSVGLGILSVVFTEFLYKLPICVFIPIAALCWLVFYTVAPVIHKNHPVSETRMSKMRRFARVYSTIIGILLCILCIAHTVFFVPVFMAYFTTAVSAIIGFYSKNRLRY